MPTTPGKPGSYSYWQKCWAKKWSGLPDAAQGLFCTAEDKLCQTSHRAPPDSAGLWTGRVAWNHHGWEQQMLSGGLSRRGVTLCRGDSSASSVGCSRGLPQLPWESSWPKAEAGTGPKFLWAWGAAGSTALKVHSVALRSTEAAWRGDKCHFKRDKTSAWKMILLGPTWW